MATNIPSPLTVSGKVFDNQNNPLPGVVIRAYDRDMRSEQLLGEAITDRKGGYLIRYTKEKFAQAEKDSADLLMRIFTPDGKTVLYAMGVDEIRFNAADEEEIDIRLENDLPATNDEFDELLATITPLIGKITIDKLQETDANQDISFLVGETGIGQEKLEHLVVAYRLAKTSKVEPTFFYALLRQNTLLKADFSKVFQLRFSIGESTDTQPLLYEAAVTDPKVITQDVNTAVEAKLVPASTATNLEKSLQALAKYADKARQYFAEEQPKKMIGIIGEFVLSGKIAALTDEYAKAGSDFPLFLNKIFSPEFFTADADSDGAKAALTLSQLLGYEPAIVAAIGREQGIKKPEDLKKLAALNKAEWKETLTASAAKLGGAGGPLPKELIDHHASSLARKLEKQFPSEAYRAQLNREKKPFLPSHDQVKDFLNTHDDFQLDKTPIDHFLQSKNISGPKTEGLRVELKKMQRVLRLVPRYTPANALLGSKFHSAQHITAVGKGRFVKEIAPTAGLSPDEAKGVFAKAEKIHTAAMLIAGDLQSTVHTADVPALGMKTVAAKLERVSKDFPSMKSLFQSTDDCACEHCRSVYSPAAYLLDGMHWIFQRSVTDTTTNNTGMLAKKVLTDRRPDLGEIDLGCENAETPLPYIDLVCEILEEAVAPDLGLVFVGEILADPTKNTGKVSAALLAVLQGAGMPVTADALVFETESTGPTTTLPHYLRDTKVVCKIINTAPSTWTVTRLRQTLLTAEELAAAPQYVNEAAYTALNLPANAFAFTLPFDLHEAEARAYFNGFGLARADLMREFQLAGNPADESIAAERLGISDSERKIIVTADPGNQQLYWCTGALNAVDTMKVVDTFLTKTGLSFEDLDTLLALQFIDPANNLFIRHLDPDLSSCDTTEKEIANLDDNALDRLHRFLRLQKKSRWKAPTMDELLSQPKFGNGNLDNNCLKKAADALEIGTKTGMTPEELVCCYGQFPHRVLPRVTWTLYDAVFQNKAKNGSVEPGLSADSVAANEAAAIKKQLADYKTAIAVCLQIREQDFDPLTAGFANTDLSFANLSLFYGISRLLKRLKLKADDYLILTTLTGLNPFNTTDDTLAFIEAAGDVKGYSLKLADIRYMLRHEAVDLPNREMPDGTIDTLLRGVQAADQLSWLKYRSPYDDSLSADEQKAAAGALLSVLPLLSAGDVAILLNFADQNWVYAWTDEQYVTHTGSIPADALTFITDKKLSTLFDTTPIVNTLTALGAAVAPNIENARKAFLKALMDTISAWQIKNDKQSILTTALVSAFKSDSDTVLTVLQNAKLKQVAPGTDVLLDLLTSDALIDTAHPVPVLPVINAAVFPKQYGAIRLLHKLLPLIDSFGPDTTQTEWMLKNNSGLGWFELDKIPFQSGQVAIPYAAYGDLSRMLALIKSWTPVANPADAGNPLSFLGLLDLLPAATTTRAEWITSISLLSGYDPDSIDAIDTYFGYTVLPADFSLYKQADTWKSLVNCADYQRKLGVTIDRIQAFIKPVLTAADTELLKNALKALYDEASWPTALTRISNAVRPRKRDALVAYLLATHPDLEDVRDLYDFYLVDTQMESCMQSSRIVLAHGTLQLFVERCLMGAEPKATADTTHDTAWSQWAWMKNYRVWEANRKVFLYPENYIEPDLLDNKSFLFDQLINESRQNALTEDSSTDLITRYLEKLDDLSFLEVVASWYEVDALTMHVFARTKGGDPKLYYYRKFIQERTWTPWEPVDLDITSDLIVAFMRNNRLSLAWGVFSDEPKPVQTSKIPSTTAGTTVNNDTPLKKLKIQLAVSEYSNGQWKPKKVSVDGITTPGDYVSTDIPRGQYNLMYMQPVDQLWIFSSRLRGQTELNEINGIFDVTGCKGYPELAFGGSRKFNDFFPDFRDAQLESQRYDELNKDKTDDLAVRNALSPFAFYQILQQTPGKSPTIPSASFRLTYPLQMTTIDLIAMLFEILLLLILGKNERGRQLKIPFGTLLPYFMEDSNHAYVLIPGFYTKKTQQDGSVVLTDDTKRTASDVFSLLAEITALFNTYLGIYLADPTHDMAALGQQLVQDENYQDVVAKIRVYQGLQYGEQFKNLYHPLICYLRSTLYKNGVPGLMSRETQRHKSNFDFASWYHPQPVVPLPYPVEDVDFSSDGSYSQYNWELFFHTPLLLATQLSNDQQFEEALTWFHYIFNPTGALDGAAPEKYWVTRPFFEMTANDYTSQRIDKLLYRVADPTSPDLDALEFAIDQWRKNPFQPHVVARYRPVAYQKATVMKYIKNLLDWGDYLFRQDTMESIVQATRLYTLADRLMGPRPRKIPPTVKAPYETYNQIEAKIDAFGNALIELENILPDLSVLPEQGAELPTPPVSLSMLYFCVPSNDDLLTYWDQIDNRLFNIRHCRNIDGVERSLALFAPPIDPGLLVRAAAAGLDIASILSGLNAPIPFYRFSVLSQKATELIQEVRTLGSSLLQALEKKDGEGLANLRSQLDIQLLKAVRDMKKQAIDDAKQQIVVLQRTRDVTNERFQYYLAIEKISAKEQLNLDKMQESQDFQQQAQIVRTVAGILGLIPEMNVGANGFGGSPEVVFQFGGTALSRAATVAADVLGILGSIASYEASRAATLGGYDRRDDDWQLQERLADKELAQIDQQIIAAQIKQQIAETDLNNHDQQTSNAQKIDALMHSKFTNEELYSWMIGQVSTIYFGAYQLAFDIAKKAERCYQHELGSDDTYIGYGYWDSLKQGLQSADRLLYDVKRMEAGYLNKNRREYEIVKPVLLALLDPLALAKLRATGSCDIIVPEVLYDMDFSGHYFRRIKSVSLSIPCIAGPYTTLGAKLSLVSNRYRKNTVAGGGYAEDPGNDDRFVYNVGSIQSITASTGQNESGVFELNFRDERYLPFEGCGAISNWRLELPDPAVVEPFDYDTIADVVLNIKYTAREGGSSLKTAAADMVRDGLDAMRQQLQAETGLHLAFNLRHDLPNEWNMLRKNKTVALTIPKSRLPYFIQNIDSAEIDHVIFVARPNNSPAAFALKIDGVVLNLNLNPDWKLYVGNSPGIDLDTAFTLSIDSQVQLDNLAELMMIVNYKFS